MAQENSNNGERSWGQFAVDAIGGGLSGLGSKNHGEAFRQGVGFSHTRIDRAEKQRQRNILNQRQRESDRRAQETHEDNMWKSAQAQLINSMQMGASGYRNREMNNLKMVNGTQAVDHGFLRPLNERQRLQVDDMAQYSKQMAGTDNLLALYEQSMTNPNMRARGIAQQQAKTLGARLGFQTKVENGKLLINAPDLGWVEGTYQNGAEIKKAYSKKMNNIQAMWLMDKQNNLDADAGARLWAGQHLHMIEGMNADEIRIASEQYEKAINSTPVGQRANKIIHSLNRMAAGKEMSEMEMAQAQQVFKDMGITWEMTQGGKPLIDAQALRDAINRGNPEGQQLNILDGKTGMVKVDQDLLRALRGDTGITRIWEKTRDDAQDAVTRKNEAFAKETIATRSKKLNEADTEMLIEDRKAQFEQKRAERDIKKGIYHKYDAEQVAETVGMPYRDMFEIQSKIYGENYSKQKPKKAEELNKMWQDETGSKEKLGEAIEDNNNIALAWYKDKIARKGKGSMSTSAENRLFKAAIRDWTQKFGAEGIKAGQINDPNHVEAERLRAEAKEEDKQWEDAGHNPPPQSAGGAFVNKLLGERE